MLAWVGIPVVVGTAGWLYWKASNATSGALLNVGVGILACAPFALGHTYATMGWEFDSSALYLLACAGAMSSGLIITYIILLVPAIGPPEITAELSEQELARKGRRKKRAIDFGARCFFVGAILGASLGALDGLSGLIGGGSLGAALRLFAFMTTAVWFGPELFDDAETGAHPSSILLFGRVVVLLPFLVFVIHDAIWYANWFAAYNALNLSSTTSAVLKHDDNQPDLQSDLRPETDGWALPVLVTKPLRWALSEENAALCEATLDLVDVANDREPGRLGARKDQFRVNADIQAVLGANDTRLCEVASSINARARAEGDASLRKAWTYQAYLWLAERREKMLRGAGEK
jgi:hypothetical protein